MFYLLDDTLLTWLRDRGFAVTTSDGSAHGVLRGLPVELREAPRGETAAIGIFIRRQDGSDLDLDARPARGIFDGDTTPTGSRAFDDVFVVHVAPEEREFVPATMSAGVRAGFAALAVGGYPHLHDDHFRVHAVTIPKTPPELDTLLARCVDVVLEADAAAAMLPSPKPLRHDGIADALLEHARSMNLSVRANPLVVEGAVDGAHLILQCRAYGSHASRGCRLHVRFREPLGVGLDARRASAFDRAKELIGLGDIHTGDADFDRAWTLRARDPDGLRAMCGDEARRVLSQLAEGSIAVTLDDDTLIARYPLPTSLHTLPRLLTRAAELRSVLRGSASVGPYR